VANLTRGTALQRVISRSSSIPGAWLAGALALLPLTGSNLSGATPHAKPRRSDSLVRTRCSMNLRSCAPAERGNLEPDLPQEVGWHLIPNTRLQSVCPQDPTVQAVDGCRAVIEAWSGAVADTKRDRMIIWGGGHADYYGNEVYALDLNSLLLQRLNNPSNVGNVTSCPEAYVDGAPSSRHTYSGLAYIAHADHMFVYGGAKSSCGFFSTGTWTLDLATLHWQQMKGSGAKPAGGPGQVAEYDPKSKLVFLHDYVSGVFAYNFDTDSWKQVLSDGYGIDYHMSGALDPKRGLFIILGALSSHGGGVQAYKIGPGSASKTSPKVDASCKDALSAGSPGVAYDSALDRLVVWPNFGSTVYLLDETTWACQAVDYANGPSAAGQPGAPGTVTGTFGRFRYFPDKDIFALVNQAGADAYVLKIGGSNTPAAPKEK
jgi:hypothetical protein